MLRKNAQALALNGDPRDCAEVALWFRSLMPSHITLVFFDEGYSADVVVEASTTIDELVAPSDLCIKPRNGTSRGTWPATRHDVALEIVSRYVVA